MEKRYEEMNSRNIYFRKSPSIETTIEKGRCLAAYALGSWNLLPSFQRLQTRLKALLGDTACLYTATPENGQGFLHQTLLQFVKFNSKDYTEAELVKSMDCVSSVLAHSGFAPSIEYRGLVWTPTGIALAGYSDDEEKILKLRKLLQEALESESLPCEIPYANDILHATVVRWVKQPDSYQLRNLEKEVERWSECVFGQLRVHQWTVGKGSWRMLDQEREDFFAVPVHTFVCHRGNLCGPNPLLENNIGTLIQREIQGYYVEIDVWYKDKQLWLGHDKPEYKTTWDWLTASKKRLIHAKDKDTLEYLLLESGKRATDLHIFYHTDEDYVLTNKGLVITYPGKPLVKGGICMMPEKGNYSSEDLQTSFWICSDTNI